MPAQSRHGRRVSGQTGCSSSRLCVCEKVKKFLALALGLLLQLVPVHGGAPQGACSAPAGGVTRRRIVRQGGRVDGEQLRLRAFSCKVDGAASLSHHGRWAATAGLTAAPGSAVNCRG